MRALLAFAAVATLASCSAPSREPVKVTFELVNAGPCAAYVQVGGGRHLSLSKDGASQKFAHDCSVCDCEMCPSCAVCGVELATVARIGPGETYTDTWDGRVWKPGTGSGTCSQGCERPTVAADGSWLAEVAFGNAAQQESYGTTVTGAVKTTQAFRHPDETTVEIALDTTPFAGLAGSECPTQ